MTNFDMFVDVVESFTCPCHFTMLNHCLSSVRGMHYIVLYLLCMWWNKKDDWGCCNVIGISAPKPVLIHWGQATHIWVSKLGHYRTFDKGLVPILCQAIIWSDVVLSITPLGTNWSAISIKIQTFPFKKMHLKMSSANWYILCIYPNMFKSNLAKFRVSRTPISVVNHFQILHKILHWYSRTPCKI